LKTFADLSILCVPKGTRSKLWVFDPNSDHWVEAVLDGEKFFVGQQEIFPTRYRRYRHDVRPNEEGEPWNTSVVPIPEDEIAFETEHYNEEGILVSSYKKTKMAKTLGLIQLWRPIRTPHKSFAVKLPIDLSTPDLESCSVQFREFIKSNEITSRNEVQEALERALDPSDYGRECRIMVAKLESLFGLEVLY